MSLIEEALRILCHSGLISAYLISAKLGISVSEAESIIGALLAEGYLKAKKIKSCGSCPLKNICPFAGKAKPREIYYLTNRGREACRRIAEWSR